MIETIGWTGAPIPYTGIQAFVIATRAYVDLEPVALEELLRQLLELSPVHIADAILGIRQVSDVSLLDEPARFRL